MSRDAAFYISRGFDRPMAEYMAKGRRRAVEAWAVGSSAVRVRFDDGELRDLDVAGLISPGNAFSFLSEPGALARVYVDADGSVCWDRDPGVDSDKVWSNKVDVSADDIYVYGKRRV